ncbi:hypothetical protein ACW18Z_00395 [Limosilactobacillus fermentum]
MAKDRSEVVKAAIKKYLREVAEDFKAHMPSKELIVDNQRLTRHELSKQLGVEIDLIRNRTPRDGQSKSPKNGSSRRSARLTTASKLTANGCSLPQLAECYHLSVETVDSRWKRGKRGVELIKPVQK